MNHKIEKMPTLWVVTTEYGEYSDYEIKTYCIKANSREEAIKFFCQFAEETELDYHVLFKNGVKFVSKSLLKDLKQKEEDIKWGYGWGFWDGNVKPLKVIYTSRYIK